jgi:hypothetical protein
MEGFHAVAGEPTAHGNSSSIIADGGHGDPREEIFVPGIVLKLHLIIEKPSWGAMS